MVSKSRGFCFTWNNYDESVEEYLRELSAVKYLVAGREVGASGTKHLQGTVVFNSPKALKGVFKKLKGAHVEVCRDIAASIEYCKKEKDFFEVGSYKSRKDVCKDMTAVRKAKNAVVVQAGISGLKDLVDSGFLNIKEVPLVRNALRILAENQTPYRHDTTRGIYVFGPPRTGKSFWALDNYPDAYMKAQNKWFDGYSGQETIILDDLDSNVLGHYLKIWMQEYPCTGEVKGGTVQLCHKRFIVTTNYALNELFKDDLIMADAIGQRCEIIQYLGYQHFIVKQPRINPEE